MTAKSFLSSAILFFLSVLFFSFAHPGFVFPSGFALFGWFSYIPVFMLIRRSSVRSAILWGAAYGFFRFFVLLFWLFGYNQAGLLGISLAMAGETALIFLLCAFLQKEIPAFSWLLMPQVMLLFEFLRTTGELGFSYGVIGYSQWQVIPLIASARFFGVWGISFVIMLFGSVVADWLFSHNVRQLRSFSLRDTKKVFFFIAIFFFLILCGLFPRSAPENKKSLSIALIQPNSDPWKDGVDAYQDELNELIRLTDTALKEHPETQLVVWSETAFVPDIVRHYTERKDASRYRLSKKLLSYIDKKNCAFVLGNNHQERTAAGENEYNSALFFEPKKNVIPPRPVVYNKMRLVPFSEQIPYPRLLSPFARLFGEDSHYWARGEELTVFEADDIRFCTPICFEDTFPQHVKKMRKAGADLIVNLSNDSWSHSLACQNQHLSMAVFRSVENNVPTIRSTASGQTCVIDSHGRITAMAEPFTATYLFATVKIGEK